MSWIQDHWGYLVNLDGVNQIGIEDAENAELRLQRGRWAVVARGPQARDFKFLFDAGSEEECRRELDRIMRQLVPNPPRPILPSTGPR